MRQGYGSSIIATLYGFAAVKALPVAQLNRVQVQGLSLHDGSVDAFLGIQYATVSERFERSRLLKVDELEGNFLNASEFGYNCYQSYPELPDFIHNRRDEAEECLFLNIWKPHNVSGPLPVMVWIHGGGFALGSGADKVNQGDILAKNQDVLVVTINYRLGALGFMPQDDTGFGGMNGLYDQIFALEWVQQNIESFSGDKDRVTLFGESAGGESICMLSVSPRARGLFHRAILQSGECVNNNWVYGVPTDDFSLASVLVEDLLEITGAASFDELKNATKFPGHTLNTVAVGAGWPVIALDLDLLPRHPRELYKDPSNIVPTSFLIGSNSYEDAMLLAMAPSQYINMTKSFEHAISTTAGLKYGDDTASQATFAYNPDSEVYDGDEVAAYAQYHGDFYIRCPTRAYAYTVASASANVYVYNFAHYSATDPMNFFGLQNFVDTTRWASHLAEIPFVFGTLEVWRHHNGVLTEDDWNLGHEMQSRWVEFAKHGHPNQPMENNGMYDEWVPIQQSGQTLVFTEGRSQMATLSEKETQCSIYPYYRHKMDSTVTNTPTEVPMHDRSSGSAPCWLGLHFLALPIVIALA